MVVDSIDLAPLSFLLESNRIPAHISLAITAEGAVTLRPPSIIIEMKSRNPIVAGKNS